MCPLNRFKTGISIAFLFGITTKLEICVFFVLIPALFGTHQGFVAPDTLDTVRITTRMWIILCPCAARVFCEQHTFWLSCIFVSFCVSRRHSIWVIWRALPNENKTHRETAFVWGHFPHCVVNGTNASPHPRMIIIKRVKIIMISIELVTGRMDTVGQRSRSFRESIGLWYE